MKVVVCAIYTLSGLKHSLFCEAVLIYFFLCQSRRMMNSLHFHDASVHFKYQSWKLKTLMHSEQSLFIIIIICDALFIDSLRRAYEPTVWVLSVEFDFDM